MRAENLVIKAALGFSNPGSSLLFNAPPTSVMVSSVSAPPPSQSVFIIQKLTQLGQPPTDALNLAKLIEALEISSLNQLWPTISLKADPTYAEIVTTCKRYDALPPHKVVDAVKDPHNEPNSSRVV